MVFKILISKNREINWLMKEGKGDSQFLNILYAHSIIETIFYLVKIYYWRFSEMQSGG